MIPKIAHFHWTGPSFPWLRMYSIATFKKFNPTWEIRLHDTPPNIRQYGLKYWQEADWTWWEQLYLHGGFQVATDIVFLRPIPDEWLDAEYCMQLDSDDVVYQCAMVGAAPGTRFFSEVVKRCSGIARAMSDPDDQAFGAILLRELSHTVRGCNIARISHSALCSIPWQTPEVAFGSRFDPPGDAIGIHWFGVGNKMKELEVGPGSQAYIAKLAESMFP